MRASHSLAHEGGELFDPSADIVGVRTPQGEELYMDRAKKLVQGCIVAVFLDGHFMLVGKIIRRPVPFRRLVIGYADVHGNKGVTRMFGLKDDDTQVLRVVGVMNRLPFAVEPEEGGPSEGGDAHRE